ncbi:MAG: hypothetical protein NC308_11140 [Clostridium sp.]|nr:hypothetical protein [Bacteroides sp.]MCM1199431.1 hypothetical protein [Clostridium sp.]
MNYIKLLLVAFPILFASCRNVSHVVSSGDETSAPEVFPKVFRYQNIQDSLCHFLRDIDSFPNPYGPPIYTITCEEYRSDTLIKFYAYGQIMGDVTVPGEIPLIPLGAFEYDGKVIVVNYEQQVSGAVHSIIDLSLFSMDIYSKYLYNNGPVYEWDVPPVMHRYKLSDTTCVKP